MHLHTQLTLGDTTAAGVGGVPNGRNVAGARGGMVDDAGRETAAGVVEKEDQGAVGGMVAPRRGKRAAGVG